MELQLHRGRPSQSEGRDARELKTYDLLDRLGISFERVDHEAAFTMEACQAIDAVLYPAVICKNLFLCNRQKTDFYLLMIRDDKKFLTKEISGQIQSSRLSFAPEEYLKSLLNLEPGSVSVLGLMNDVEGKVKLLVDEDVLKAEYFGCHPCVNTSSIRVKTSDIFQTFLQHIGHGYRTVVLSG